MLNIVVSVVEKHIIYNGGTTLMFTLL